MFSFPAKMLKVFKDEHIQARFERDGYVILPFYSEFEMEELRKLYHTLHPQNEVGFFPSTFSSDKDYRRMADVEIRRLCERSMQLYLCDYKTVLGAFIAKNPGPESGMCVHQDMSLVDESRFTGINIWVPLIDLNIKNGCLFVLPGSHRLFPTYRGSSIPEFFQDVNEYMIDYLHPIEVKAGEAVFFDQSIIHFSPPNYSDEVRIVTNTYFTHKDAEYRTYFFDKAKPGYVEEFMQDDSFMTDFDQFGNNIHERPKVGTSLGFTAYDFPLVDVNFLAQRFHKTQAREMIEREVPIKPAQEIGTQEKVSFFKRILQKIT